MLDELVHDVSPMLDKPAHDDAPVHAEPAHDAAPVLDGPADDDDDDDDDDDATADHAAIAAVFQEMLLANRYLRSHCIPYRLLRALVRSFRGASRTVAIRVPVPRDARPGRYELTLTGTPADTAQQGASFEEVLAAGFGAQGSEEVATEGPASMDELVARVAMLQRVDGVSASLVRAGRRSRSGADGGGGEPVYVSDRERISGSASVAVRVVRR